MQARIFQSLLVSCISLTDAYKVLFFFAVDSQKDTQDLVKSNVEYAKLPEHGGPDCCEVMLAHYAGTPEDWVDKAWYSDNVVRNVVGPGYKFHHMKTLYHQDNEEAFSWEDRYEFIWALDSDIDIKKMDLRNFFKLTRLSGSHIVTPTFEGDSGMWRAYNLAEQEKDKDSESLQINVIGKPDDHCLYRHTTFAEMTAPVLRASVLSFLMDDAQCDHCIGEHAEWGLDRIWCSITGGKTGNQRPCAYVDMTPVMHLDWQRAHVTGDFHNVELDVKAHHAKEWSDIKNVQCFPRPGMQPSTNVNPAAHSIALR